MFSNIPNLDIISARYAQNMVKETFKKKVKDQKEVNKNHIENLVTKSLGVIQENGVYAGSLYLLSRAGNADRRNQLKPEEFVACQILFQLLEIFKAKEIKDFMDLAVEDIKGWGDINTHKDDILDHFTKEPDGVCSELDKLLLVKSLFEQTLTYARYHAKALSDAENGTSDTDEDKPQRSN